MNICLYMNHNIITASSNIISKALKNLLTPKYRLFTEKDEYLETITLTESDYEIKEDVYIYKMYSNNPKDITNLNFDPTKIEYIEYENADVHNRFYINVAINIPKYLELFKTYVFLTGYGGSLRIKFIEYHNISYDVYYRRNYYREYPSSYRNEVYFYIQTNYISKLENLTIDNLHLICYYLIFKSEININKIIINYTVDHNSYTIVNNNLNKFDDKYIISFISNTTKHEYMNNGLPLSRLNDIKIKCYNNDEEIPNVDLYTVTGNIMMITDGIMCAQFS